MVQARPQGWKLGPSVGLWLSLVVGAETASRTSQKPPGRELVLACRKERSILTVGILLAFRFLSLAWLRLQWE